MVINQKQMDYDKEKYAQHTPTFNKTQNLLINSKKSHKL